MSLSEIANWIKAHHDIHKDDYAMIFYTRLMNADSQLTRAQELLDVAVKALGDYLTQHDSSCNSNHGEFDDECDCSIPLKAREALAKIGANSNE